jgi:hypothetical protein
MFRGCVAWTGVVSSHRDHNLMPQGGSMVKLFNKNDEFAFENRS